MAIVFFSLHSPRIHITYYYQILKLSYIIFFFFLSTICQLILLSGAYYYYDKPAPIPKFSFNEIIDPQLVEYVKTASIDKYNEAVNVTSTYWLYLSEAAQNSAIEAKKLWSENFPY